MDTFIREFQRAFIERQRYMLFLEGMANTLMLSLLAAAFGILIGIFIPFLGMFEFGFIHNRGLRIAVRKVSRAISFVYLDVIRGTPSFIQMLVIYFVVFAGSGLNKILIAAVAFGMNSGAYVSEIIRAGILSVDKGQTEAGRSLGLSGYHTMSRVVLPQAVKNVLPALANEFIILIKETAVAGYIAVMDITKAANIVSASIYSVTFPLLGAAVIYYVITKILSTCFKGMEHRLRRSDRGVNL